MKLSTKIGLCCLMGLGILWVENTLQTQFFVAHFFCQNRRVLYRQDSTQLPVFAHGYHMYDLPPFTISEMLISSRWWHNQLVLENVSLSLTDMLSSLTQTR